MRAHNIALGDIFKAVKASNMDVGARTIEINKVEYIIRGLGFIKELSDIEKSVIKVNDNVPICIKDVAKVSYGPALRRGALDKGGAEAVGGVVVVRYGFNPLEAIKNVKKKIDEISPGLPKKTLADGTVSQVKIVPFYDRTGLIYETLDTLSTALTEEVLVTIIVVIVLVLHLRSSVLISALLPLAILMVFIAMKTFGIDANIVALSGIAIAIGTMVDMGIIICENILNHLDEADPDENKLEVIFKATSEVGSAVLTAVSTTIVGFLPVFTMTGAEGKLFRPLAYTKTFALVASVIVALTIIPPAAHVLFTRKRSAKKIGRYVLAFLLLVAAGAAAWRPRLANWGPYRHSRHLSHSARPYPQKSKQLTVAHRQFCSDHSGRRNPCLPLAPARAGQRTPSATSHSSHCSSAACSYSSRYSRCFTRESSDGAWPTKPSSSASP